MRAPATGVWILFLASTGASHAQADGVGTIKGKDPSSAERIYGAFTVRPLKGGVFAVGGAALRVLPSGGSRRWETLHAIPGGNLYRVTPDDSGRLLAAWETDPALHVFSNIFTPGARTHVSLPRPVAPADVRNFQIASLEFLPNSRDALVYMTGNVMVTTGQFRGPAWSTSAYRIALDGKSAPRLIFRVDHGYRLHTSRFGALFAMPTHQGQTCDHRGCSIAAVVAYEIAGDRATPRTVVDAAHLTMDRAQVLRGSDDQRVLLLLDLSRPRRSELVRWRFGQTEPEFRRTVDFRDDSNLPARLLTRSNDLIELRNREGPLEIWRLSAKGDEKLASLKALQNIEAGIFGLGERADGGLWWHWGDHVGLLAPGTTPRQYNLTPLLPRKSEWTGDTYVAAPEHLWIGIDGRGRDFVRVDFSDIEKRATPWPTGVPSATPPEPRGEYVGSNANDGSTSDRLNAAVGARPVPGGMVSMGASALRRLVNGAKKWETLFAIPGDSLYRVAADESGRLLAAWEKDPLIHLFLTAESKHVSFPKPPAPAGALDGFHVDQLAFASNGRDALVFGYARLDATARQCNLAYRIALDGRSEAKLLYRVDNSFGLYTGRAGGIVAIPENLDPAYKNALHFWPLGAIVAHEITDTGVMRRVLLTGDEVNRAGASWAPGGGDTRPLQPTAEPVDMAGAQGMRGNNDQRVAFVVDLRRRHGPQRLGAGRSLLRWTWGTTQPEYRSLPGNSSVTPMWLLTATNDFIEVTHRYDVEPEFLEIRRFAPGNGPPQVTNLKAVERRPTPHGFGERSNGSLWLHWGENLVLLSPGSPARRFNIDSLLQRGFEWADAYSYVMSPESLWVGLDGRGRNYARVDLGTVEKQAKAW